MADKPRPYLTAALLCERVLQENDGTISIIRVADRVAMQLLQGTLPADAKPIFNISCFVALKSGPAKGDYTLRLVLMNPSGNMQGVPIEQPVNLLGQDHGQNFIVNLFVSVVEEGLHWVHVSLDDMELTRIPLIVVRPQPGQETK